jgi:hypothetical protein
MNPMVSAVRLLLMFHVTAVVVVTVTVVVVVLVKWSSRCHEKVSQISLALFGQMIECIHSSAPNIAK